MTEKQQKVLHFMIGQAISCQRRGTEAKTIKTTTNDTRKVAK